MRARTPAVIVALMAAIAGPGTMSGAATPQASGAASVGLHSNIAGCNGKEYPTYEYSPTGYVLANGATSPSRLDVIKVPSYDPTGEVVHQWPVGCTTNFGNDVTTYLFVSSGPVTSATQVLPLSKVRPVAKECVKAVAPSTDGNAYPLTCQRDEVNVVAWVYYAEDLPRLFTLGRSTTRCQVYEALLRPSFSHEEALSTPEITASYTLASTYYGWHFGISFPASRPTSWERRCATDK